MTPDEFRKIRKAARMTQAKLAERLGKSRLTINNWETGKYTIPAGALDTLTEKGILPNEPKETKKEERERLAAEKHLVEYWVQNYTSTRAWPQYNNHRKAMALYASQSVEIPAIAHAAILARWPDILSDPNGDYTMTKEQSHAVLLKPPTTKD